MRFIPVLLLVVFLGGCSGKSMTKILKNPDPEFKLRMAEKYYVQKKWQKATVIYEDIMPYYKTRTEFQDIYYKFAYCAYNQADYLNAENLFKTFLEIFPNSPKAEEVDFMRAYCYYKQSPKPELDQTNTIKTVGMMQIFINTHPGSERNKQANEIIDICRKKLEIKDQGAAQLYYDIGQYRAAATAFNALLNTFPESDRADEYKMMAIKSYYRFAQLSVDEKKMERYEKVIEECNEFMDRFHGSQYEKEVEDFLNQSQNNLKTYTNEPAKKTA